MTSSNQQDPPAAGSKSQPGMGQDANFKYVQMREPPEDSYADGAAAISGGRNVVKIDLYRTVGFDAEDKKEIRTLSHRMVLPMTAIPELMRLLQGYDNAVQKAFKEMAERSNTNFDFTKKGAD